MILQVKVKPNARTCEFVQAADGTWLASLNSPPVDGKANAELVALVDRQFNCPRASVSIKAGASGRTKLVKIGPREMTLKRMDNVLIVVDDLEAVKAFFIELGLELEGETTVEGPLVGSLIGLAECARPSR